MRKGEQAISPFFTVFCTLWENYPPFSQNLELSSANSFNLGGLKFKIKNGSGI